MGTRTVFGRSNLAPLEKYSDSAAQSILSACRTGVWFESSPQSLPRTIPLYIPLGPNLTHPAEIAYAESVAKHLSGECGLAIGVSDLAGLFLYLWSEDDPDGQALDDYLSDHRRPLQALLLQIRNLEGQAESLARTELLPFVGQRFEI